MDDKPVPVVLVPVKSLWWSKINWLQILGSVVTLFTTNAFGFDDATQVKVLAVVNIVQGIVTIVLKTWFTASVTYNSLSPSERTK
jgi:hypothetical protein